MTVIVSNREQLQELLHQNGVATVVQLLNYFKEKPLFGSTGVLFHGSSTANGELAPNESIGIDGKPEGGVHVYATDDPNYAIFLAIIRLRNASAGVTATDDETTLTVDVNFVNGESTIETGYVHIVPSEDFQSTGNREFVSKKVVKSLMVIPVSVDDLTVPILVTGNFE